MRRERVFVLPPNSAENSVDVRIPTNSIDVGSDCGLVRIEALDGSFFVQMYLSGTPKNEFWRIRHNLGGHYDDATDEWVPHTLSGGYRIITDCDFDLPDAVISAAAINRVMPRRHHSVAIATADAGTLLNAVGSGGTSWSHNTGSGSDRLLTIFGGYGTDWSTTPAHTTTYNSGATTVAATASFNSGAGTYRPEAFIDYVIAPASGNLTIAITFGSNINNSGMVGAIDWTGVHQTTPFAASPIQATGTSAGGTQTISNGSLTTPTNGALIDGFFIGRTGTLTGSGGGTTDWKDDGDGALNNWGAAQHTFASGSQTLGWTVDSGATWQYAHVVAGIQESSGGGGGQIVSPMPYYKTNIIFE